MTANPTPGLLDPYEKRAYEYLFPVFGSLRIVDLRDGRPDGLHDFEADLPDGGVAAIEVTGEVNSGRLGLEAEVTRRFSSLIFPGSTATWVVSLAPTARVKVIERHLLPLLGEMEAQGRNSAHNLGDYRDPMVGRLVKLGIESIYMRPASAGNEGTVLVHAGTFGGFGWNKGAIDDWLQEFSRPVRVSTRSPSLPVLRRANDI